jgi:hypothetical protein
MTEDEVAAAADRQQNEDAPASLPEGVG